MWHEARKQERIIRGLIVDYRRRAERRRDFYEKIKADPTQFLQIHGRQCKIHLDPVIAAAGDSPAIMMPWQGDPHTSIDRFDVRAHLDLHDIPDLKRPHHDEITHEDRLCNYERYRILAQNSFLGVDEEKFLHQLSVEEQFGVTLEEKELQRERAAEKKNATGAAIGYNYDDGGQPYPGFDKNAYKDGKSNDDSDEESDLDIIDVDLSIDVNKVETSQAHSMNHYGTKYGMLENDFFSFLTDDAEEAEKQKQLLREEKEKALFSGRKSRRERRAHRDKKLALRVVSPPHYAAKPSPSNSLDRSSPSPTRSASPDGGSNTITFITSFGGDDEPPAAKMSYADKVKSTERSYATVVRDGNRRYYHRSATPDLPYSRKRKPSPPSYSKSRKSTSSSSSRSRSRSRRSRSSSSTGRSRSRRLRSRSRSRSSKRTRSRSRSRRSKSRSPVRSKQIRPRSRYSRSRSRSISRKRRHSSSDRSSSEDSRRRRSYSKSSSKSRSSRSSSSSSSSSRSAKRSNHKSSSGHQKSSNVGNTSYNTDSNSGPVNRLPRYYGRKREGCRASSSELSISSDDEKSNNTDKTIDNSAGRIVSQNSNVVRSSAASPKRSKPSSERISLKEKLRRKMQAQLSRQLRADKKAEAERLEREQQLLQERDDEMRELAIKIRRRQRELRHQRQSRSSEDRSSTSSKQRDKNSDDDSRDGSPPRKEKKSKREDDQLDYNVKLCPRDSRSSSRSPQRKKSRDSEGGSSKKRIKLVDY